MRKAHPQPPFTWPVQFPTLSFPRSPNSLLATSQGRRATLPWWLTPNIIFVILRFCFTLLLYDRTLSIAFADRYVYLQRQTGLSSSVKGLFNQSYVTVVGNHTGVGGMEVVVVVAGPLGGVL